MKRDLNLTGLFDDRNLRTALRKCGICIPTDTPIPPELRRLALAQISSDLKRLMLKAQELTAGVDVDLTEPLPPHRGR